MNETQKISDEILGRIVDDKPVLLGCEMLFDWADRLKTISSQKEVVKVTLERGMKLYILFEDLTKFKANIANISKLEPIIMSDKKYSEIPISNQSDIFF